MSKKPTYEELEKRVRQLEKAESESKQAAEELLKTNLMIEALLDAIPDVIGVQEAHRFQLDDMRELLPEYGEIGTGRGGGTEDEYSAILYLKGRFRVAESGTFWLSDSPETASITWGNACIRMST